MEGLIQGRPVRVGDGRFEQFRDETSAFEQLVALEWGIGGGTLLEGQLRRTPKLVASRGLLDLLGVQPIIGRPFSPDAVHMPGLGSNLEMMLTYELWQRLFGGDSTVVGRTVTLGRTRQDVEIPRTIVGVLPRGFQLPPLRLGGRLGTSPFEIVLRMPDQVGSFRGTDNYVALGKLREDTSLDQARTQLDVLTARMGVEYPDEAGFGALLTPIGQLPRAFYGRALFLLWAPDPRPCAA